MCGTDRLRELISALHPGSTADEVLVTVGAAEANSIIAETLVAPGDHVVVLEPSYRQMWGAMRNLGAEVESFHLRVDDGWRPDIDELRAVIRPDTRLVCLANPNNPTGRILTPVEMAEIVDACRVSGAWLVVDEVYRGSERLTDVETPTVFGTYERLVVTGSLSKSYGLSGLRIGWLVAPRPVRDDAWRRHEYAVIAASNVSMHLAELALTEPIARASCSPGPAGYIREGWTLLEAWLRDNEDLVSAHAPGATALAFVRYAVDLPSAVVADEIRKAGVLVAPGDAFGVEGHLRITHGVHPERLQPALATRRRRAPRARREPVGRSSASARTRGSSALSAPPTGNSPRPPARALDRRS